MKSLLFSQNKDWDFSGSSMVRTQYFLPFQGATGLIPGQGTKIPPSREIIKIRELSRVDEVNKVNINMPKSVMLQT